MRRHGLRPANKAGLKAEGIGEWVGTGTGGRSHRPPGVFPKSAPDCRLAFNLAHFSVVVGWWGEWGGSYCELPLLFFSKVRRVVAEQSIRRTFRCVAVHMRRASLQLQTSFTSWSEAERSGGMGEAAGVMPAAISPRSAHNYRLVRTFRRGGGQRITPAATASDQPCRLV